MEGNRVRETFIEFFRKHGHQYVRSSSLVPHEDPTLLFANAGMNQFKEIFTGARKSEYATATSHQKCVRAGGKHNDFEIVGRSRKHQTFFEMLGNFSFGDYFKEKAIELAWDLCLNGYGLDPKDICVSVFREDDEAYRLWNEKIGVPAEKIYRLDEKDNFWAMGDTGPCGPCSEIFIDHGPGVNGEWADEDPAGDSDRFVEFWNLVFMEFERDEQGTMTKLPHPCIDTGMGLERMAAILQGVEGNFQTDLFQPLINDIAEEVGTGYGAGGETDVSFRVIADHLRSITFLVSDGVLPANDGRGYVLRKIIRRAVRHGKLLGTGDPFLHHVTGKVADLMVSAYPELEESRSFVSRVTLSEEERFERTLAKGMKLIGDLLGRLKSDGAEVIPGDEAFKLYDTFGFPRDLIDEIASDAGLMVDHAGFGVAMKGQQERSASAAREREAKGDAMAALLKGVPRSEFLGYDGTTARDCRVTALLDGEGARVQRLEQGSAGTLVLDRTPFYGESGGQVGDQGVLDGDEASLKVTDAKRLGNDYVLHQVTVVSGGVGEGDRFDCRVDRGARRSTMANHTATHLLQAALRSVVGDHVKQAGSMVAPDRLRFDFTHFSPIDGEELRRIEREVNEVVRNDLPVETVVSDMEEAVAGGAIALFGEKYGSTVRVVSVGEYSRELCGGTHCGRTGEIGLFKILSEKSIAAGVRRVEAVTGRKSLEIFQGQQALVDDAARAVKSSPATLVEDLGRVQQQAKDLGREVEKLKMQLASRPEGGDEGGGPIEVAGIKVLLHRADDLKPPELRTLADNLKTKIGSGLVILGGVSGKKVALLVLVTPDLTDRIDAKKVIGELAPIIGGGGGGRPDLAQAGGKNPDGLPELLDRAPEILADLLG